MTLVRAVLDQAAPEYVSEAVLQQAVIARALELGYCIFWLPDEMQRIAAASKRFDVMPQAGYPDLTIVGHGRMLHVELKSQRGRLRPEQAKWRDEIQRAGGEWHLWRPEHWQSGLVDAVLQKGR